MSHGKFFIVALMFLSVPVALDSFAQLGPDDTHIGTPSPVEDEGRPPIVITDPMPPSPIEESHVDTEELPDCPDCDSEFYQENDDGTYYCFICDEDYHLISDTDNDEKGGGKDPIVFGQWWYNENNDDKCKSQYPFDYDNDLVKEDWCYDTIGKILLIDFGYDWNQNKIPDIDEGIAHGYNILNFDRTLFNGYTPIEFFKLQPRACEAWKCYLWNDSSPHDWIVQPQELEPYSFEIAQIHIYKESQIWKPNGHYVDCVGITVQGDVFNCIDPTYYKRGEIDR